MHSACAQPNLGAWCVRKTFDPVEYKQAGCPYTIDPGPPIENAFVSTSGPGAKATPSYKLRFVRSAQSIWHEEEAAVCIESPLRETGARMNIFHLSFRWRSPFSIAQTAGSGVGALNFLPSLKRICTPVVHIVKSPCR